MVKERVTSQVKRLRAALKKIGATRLGNKRLFIRAERTYAGRNNGKACYEFGYAVCHTDALSDEQIKKLKDLDECVIIANYPEHGFAIIKS